MTKDDYLEWLLQWFNQRVSITKNDVHTNYFSQGWLDSFTTLSLITDMESAFNIQFSDNHFSDTRFSTLSGLSEMITELKTI